EPRHIEFLHTDKTDPRQSLLPALLAVCGTKGSIVAYYSSFEATRISELAEFKPEFETALEGLKSRLVDLLPVIRENIYDEDFRASFSLKAVAPALLGKEYNYGGLSVSDGT